MVVLGSCRDRGDVPQIESSGVWTSPDVLRGRVDAPGTDPFVREEQSASLFPESRKGMDPCVPSTPPLTLLCQTSRQ